MDKKDLQKLIDNGVLQKDPDATLVNEELNKLVDRGFIRGLSGEYFEFDNNLTWEVVYGTILYAERRHIHTLIAKHIESYNENNVENVSDELAYHYKQAGDTVNYVWYTALSGNRAAEMFANDDAVLRFEEASRTIQDHDPECFADLSILEERVGDVYESSGQYGKAIERYLSSLGHWDKLGNSRVRRKYLQWKIKPSSRHSHLCWRVAVAAEHDSQFNESLDWLERAAKSLPQRPGKLNAQINATRSAVLYRKGDYSKAVGVGNQALQLARKYGEKRDIAYAHNILANTLIASGQLAEATKHLQKALQIFDEIEDYSGIAAANSNLGSCLQNLGDLAPAIEYFNIALNADQKIQNNVSVAMDQFNLGNALLDTGQLEMAVEYMDKVISAYSAGNCPPDLAGAAWSIRARCKLEMGHLNEAETNIEKGLTQILQTGQLGLELAAQLIKAEILLEKGLVEKATPLLENTLDTIIAVNAKLLEAQAQRVCGYAKTIQGDINGAILHLQKSLDISQEIGVDYEWALSVITMAGVVIQAGVERQQLKDELKAALRVFRKIGHTKYSGKADSIIRSLD
jgi:tetratricopeptide (TPR) repeat protein